MPDLKELNPKDLDVKPSVPAKAKPSAKFKEESFISKAGNVLGALSGYTQRNKIGSDLEEGSYRLKRGD